MVFIDIYIWTNNNFFVMKIELFLNRLEVDSIGI